MLGALRHLNVLAFADELSADPELLAAWADAFCARDELTLVIHPRDLPRAEIEPRLLAALASAGVDPDAPGAPDLVALSDPLGAADELELATRCEALFSRSPAAVPFEHLRLVQPGAWGALPVQLARRDRPRPARQITPIGEQWNVVHRGSHEDLCVIRSIFADSGYALGWFERHALSDTTMVGFSGFRELGMRSGSGERPLIIDCGANIGAASMYFSIAYPDATVFAVEPAADNFELLCENVSSFSGVHPLKSAIASESGTLLLADPGCGAWGYRTGTKPPPGREMGETQAVSIQRILDHAPETFPFILKIDIEGAEGELFSSNTDAISRFPIVIVELHDWMLPGEGTSCAFLQWHVSQRRDFVQHEASTFSLSSAHFAPQ